MPVLQATTTRNHPKGVRWNKQVGKWQSYITILNKEKSLGRFTHRIDAIFARLAGELKYWGEIKATNLPAEAEEFKDKLLAADKPHWLFQSAIHATHPTIDGVAWNTTHWVAYNEVAGALKVLGTFVKFEDAAERLRLEGVSLDS